MASSLQSFEPRVRPYESSTFGQPSSNQPNSERWEMRISFGQVVVLWAVLAGMMVMVFIFGLHAGREQGLSRALEQNETEAVRLPIARPIPEADGSGAIIPSEMDSTLESNDPDSELAASAEEDDREFDFSRSEKVAGISSKPTLELFKDDKPVAVEQEDKSAKIAALEEELKQQRLEREAKALAKKLAEDKERKEREEKAAKAAKAAEVAALSQLSPPLKKAEKPVEVEPVAKIDKPAKTQKSATTGQDIKVETTSEALSAGWYVQAAATRTGNDAVAMVAKFAAKGLAGVVEQAKVGKKEYYRVLVGPYSDKAKALDARSKVKSAKITGGEPFLKHVK